VPNSSTPTKLEPTLADKMDSTPKTGDNSQMILWLMVMILSIAIMLAATGYMVAPSVRTLIVKRREGR